jgi:hypothetical protein
MHLSRLLPVLLLAATATAHAQLKPPSKASAARAAAATAPAAAAAPAAALDAKSDPDKENAGKLAASGWLVLLDRRDWGTAWENSSAVFRKNVPLSSWMDGIPKVREPFGPLVERQAAEVVYKTALAGHPDGDYVTVVFQSRFDKKSDAKELVTATRETDGRWRVTGYSVQ